MSKDVIKRLDEARDAHRQNRLDEAQAGYAAAARLAEAAGEAECEAYALRHLSDLDRETGRLAEALEHAERAVLLYRRGLGAPLDLANALRLNALALAALGRPSEALPFWAEAGASYASLGVEAGAAECARRMQP